MIQSLKSNIAATIEITLNRTIPFDPEYINKLSRIKNKTIHLFISDWQLELFFLCTGKSFIVLSEYQGDSDVKLIGNSFDFFALGIEQINKTNNSDQTSNIRFEGDIVTGQQFQDLFNNLNIDWEEILAEFTDDFIAHHATQFAKKSAQWFSELFSTGQTNLSEYLREEKKITPSKIEVSNFYDDLAVLEARTESLLKRSQKLNLNTK